MAFLAQPADNPNLRSASKGSLWTGRILSALVAAFLLLDGVMHLTKIAPVVEAFARLDFPLHLALFLGITELVCVLLYIIPRTSILGAILLTGYLGGAIAIQLRAQSPLFGETLFPLYVGLFVWGGLFLRKQNLRTVLPFRNASAALGSKSTLWAGRIISALPILMLLFAGSIKLAKSPAMVQGFAQAGFAENLIIVIGILELSCTLVYLIPQTSVLGALLMTGFLGGATATDIRIGNPAYVVTVALGILVWLGLYLRDTRVRELISKS